MLADLSQCRRESTIDPRRLSGFKSPLGKSSILKDPSLYALSKRARSICPVVDKIEVKDSDYDSVVDQVRNVGLLSVYLSAFRSICL